MNDADRLAHSISTVQLRQGLDIEDATYAVVNGLRGSDEQKADLYAFIVEHSHESISLAGLAHVCDRALRRNSLTLQ